MRFEWDSAKAAVNLRKHGLSFDIAVRVFADPLARSAPDRIEGYEQRWRTIGQVAGSCLVVVAHTVREADQDGRMVEIIRIISARVATRQERRRHEEQND